MEYAPLPVVRNICQRSSLVSGIPLTSKLQSKRGYDGGAGRLKGCASVFSTQSSRLMTSGVLKSR